jgi:putative hemolysin
MILGELFIILLLILINGFFSSSEIALISFKRGRLKALVEEGNHRARIIEKLQQNPDQLFATVQVGVTLVGTLASVYGGASLVGPVQAMIESVGLPFLVEFAREAAFVVVVTVITYMSIVIGELVPKSLALNYSERVGLIMAYPLDLMSRIFYLFTKVLTLSSNVILRPFKDRTSFSETRLLAEEILHLLEEGVKHGSIEHTEHEIIENVLDMNDTDARDVMVPRVDIKAINIDADEEEVRRAMDLYYSRLPVYKDNLDNIVGILHLKDLMRSLSRKESYSLSRLTRPAYFVPESMKIGKILKEMQKRRSHMAIVVDEFGGTAGLLTLEDILEEIVGEIQDVTEFNEESDIIKTGENSYLVSGSCNTFDFNDFVGKDVIPESEAYTTVAGFIIEELGRFPELGEGTEVRGYRFELVKKVRQKLVQFKVIALSGEEQRKTG